MSFSLYSKLTFLTATALLGTTSVFSQALTNGQIDSLAEKDLKLFNVPGMAVGIVKDGHLIYSKGFGVRSLKTQKPVDPETLFGIASNSKAFTAAALGILVDKKKISWDDKVTKYLPDFKLYDELATKEITIRDLLCHRSGIGTGVGDLMHDPDSTTFSVNDIIHNLRYLKPDYSFRSKFAYNNNLYLVAGQVIAKVSKMPLEDFIKKSILLPLGMKSSSASFHGASSNLNITSAHKVTHGSIRVVTRYTSMKDDAAGGIYANITDMSKWLLMLINNGKYGENLNKQLLSEQTVHELLSPQTIIRTGPLDSYQTHFGAYGLGWFMNDERGYKLIFHSGEDVGMVSEVSMIPELSLGVIVLTNNESTASYAVTDQIIDGYIGIRNQDRSAATFARFHAGELTASRARDSIYRKASEQNLFLHPVIKNYIGIYQDPWFGKLTISVRAGRLYFASERSP
ncbi:MAG: serine hydrolase, partial [Sphingobacteriaceae bacterium]